MKKPIALLFTDIHIERDDIDLVKSILEQSLELAREKHIRYIFLLGDIFTERTGQNMFCLNLFLWYVGKFNTKNVNQELFIIAGNHDKVDQNIKASYLDIYDVHRNVTVINEYDFLTVDGMTFHFIPYFKDKKKIEKILNSFPTNDNDYLLTHLAFNGVMNNDGELVTEGIPIKWAKRFKKVFVGHYHNESTVGSNIHYIGSSHAHNFGENNNKGFTLLYNDGSHELIRSSFPKYIQKKIDLSVMNRVQIESLKKKYSGSENFIRFKFIGTDEQLVTIDKREYEKVGIDVKKESVELIRGVHSAENNSFVSFNSKKIKQCFFEYCSKNKITGKRKELGLNYMNKNVASS